MCGLVGLLNHEAEAGQCRDLLGRMVATLRHRGPDDSGFHVDPLLGLGHARLSIIDLSGGRQPIYNEDGSVCVVFTGEIFNYLELREELLKRGHRFATNTDTEVIVHLYEELGTDFVRQLNGQFAIALWDSARRRLVLVRDRVGIRPLYYTWRQRTLAFASEIKALFAVEGVPRRLDMQALGEIFTTWSVAPPSTAFDGIHSLGPGEMMVVEDGRSVSRCYWDWDFTDAGQPPDRPLGQCAAELRELLIDAIRLQLRSDVPVGVYLSGGLDSAIIAALVRHYTDAPLRTYSIAFAEAEFDERRYQRQMAERLGSAHHEFECTASDIARAFPACMAHLETPILRTAPVPLMLLSKKVHDEEGKVVLTGEGADETFAGYDIFREARIRRFWARQPDSACRPRLLERIYPYLERSPTSVRQYTQAFFGKHLDEREQPGFGHGPRWETTQRTWRFLHPEVRGQLAPDAPGRRLCAALPEAFSRWGPLGQDQYVEAHTLLSGYILSCQGDRVSMANSVEGRYPFLDHRITEFANNLPERFKLSGLKEKYILKQAMSDLLPASIVQRPKQPYRAPDSASFFEGGKPVAYVEDLLSRERLRDAGYFDPEAVQRLVAKCRAGRAAGFADNMAFVGILSTMMLDDTFVRRGGDFLSTGEARAAV